MGANNQPKVADSYVKCPQFSLPGAQLETQRLAIFAFGGKADVLEGVRFPLRLANRGSRVVTIRKRA